MPGLILPVGYSQSIDNALLGAPLPGTTPSIYALQQGVIPVISVDFLGAVNLVKTVTMDISAASGLTTYYTVPNKKRWLLMDWIQQVSIGASSLVYGTDLVAASGNYVYYGPATTAQQYVGGKAIQLGPGFALGLSNTNNVLDNSISLVIHYLELPG
jgi:hypothetical protein